jgi:hypothetical protein
LKYFLIPALWSVLKLSTRRKNKHFQSSCYPHMYPSKNLNFLLAWTNVVLHSRISFARGLLCTENGDDTFLPYVGFYKTCTAPHPRRRFSSSWNLLII